MLRGQEAWKVISAVNQFNSPALDQAAFVAVDPALSETKPTDVGRSRQDPSPYGQVVIAEDWQVQVTDMIRGSSAWTMVERANQFNDPPPDGKEYVAIQLHVRHIGTKDIHKSMDGSYLRLTGAANVVYDSPSIVDIQPALDVDLYPGGEAEGWITMEAAEGESRASLP